MSNNQTKTTIKFYSNGQVKSISYETCGNNKVNQYDPYANALGIPPRREVDKSNQINNPVFVLPVQVMRKQYQYGIPSNKVIYY